jgi:hypothetical protein
VQAEASHHQLHHLETSFQLQAKYNPTEAARKAPQAKDEGELL